MADSYQTVSSRKTVKVISQTQSVDVQEVGIYTKPSGVYMVVLVPLSAWNAGNAGDYLTPPASIVEGLIGEGLVTTGTYVQAIDSANLLAGFMDLTVSYTPTGGISLPFTTVVRIPMTAFVSREAYSDYAATPPHKDPIVTAYNQLVATANA